MIMNKQQEYKMNKETELKNLKMPEFQELDKFSLMKLNEITFELYEKYGISNFDYAKGQNDLEMTYFDIKYHNIDFTKSIPEIVLEYAKCEMELE